MSTRRGAKAKPRLRGFQGVLGLAALFLTIALIVFQLASSIGFAFSESRWLGIRSIAATIFPLSIAIYLGFLAKVWVPANDSRAPIINNFVIFILWALIIFGIDSNTQFVRFPLEELLYSSTLAIMMWRYKRRNSFRTLLACCYGILSGALAALILFGLNPATL